MDNVTCFKCGGSDLWGHGYRNGIKYYFCKKCKWAFPERGLIPKQVKKCPVCGECNTRKIQCYTDKSPNYFCNICNKSFSDLEMMELLKEGKIRCRKCGEIKTVDQFYKRNKIGDIYVRTCKACKPKILFKKYNMTELEYKNLLKSQNNKCMICGEVFDTERWYGANVDHSHETGLVRGLLCHACNKVLGFAKDDVSILKSAIDYLELFI
jgi:DNA-directed RNA polymerase subunit RPC12/RpoP